MLQVKTQEVTTGNVGHVRPLKIVRLIVECVRCSQKRAFVCISNLETTLRLSMCVCSIALRFEQSPLRLIPN